MTSNILFNKPYLTGNEKKYIKKAKQNFKLSGEGEFTTKCQNWLQNLTSSQKVLLTQSCTAALEMAAMLIDVQPGDEIIMPSYTFVSTANAFVLRGGVPVFVDIRPDTLNIDEKKIEAAITPKTKAIVPVHYAGVACEMDAILEIAKKHNLYVIEDAAQAIMSTYKGRPLGGIGHLAAFSFHETKNIISGEGGALIINDKKFIDRAEIIWEKGTNRSRYFRGQVDKYTWVDIGSSYLPSEITAAFLWAQIEIAEKLTQERLNIWDNYHHGFLELEKEGKLRRPIIPSNCQHNAHMYYLLLKNLSERTEFIKKLNDKKIHCVFHYVPLHSSPAGTKYGRPSGKLTITDSISDRLVRLPLWIGLESYQQYIINTASNSLVNKSLRSVTKLNTLSPAS
jgi:dTDP-4-amino-4,6-dideoxygalactose transaminase